MIQNPKLSESHFFNVDNQHFIFSTQNMTIFNVDEITLDIAKLCDGSTQNQIISKALEKNISSEDTIEILDELEKVNLLYDIHDHEQLFVKSNTIEIPDSLNAHSLALHLVHDCNLRCTYCYGSGGSYDGPRSVMSKETALKAVDFLINQNSPLKEYHIIFFGGEPLMNFEVIKSVTEYCKEKELDGYKFSLGMTTNGTLLTDEIMNFCDLHDITIGVSIDGPKEIHDSCRKCVDGSGSFELMMKNVNKLLERRNGRVTARITLTKQHLNMFDITQSIESMGFKKVNLALVSDEEGSPYALSDSDYPTIMGEYKKIADKMFDSIKHKKRFYTNIFYSHLKVLHNKQFMFYNCGAGRRYLAVSPDGKLYFCHRFAGMEDFCFGDIESGINRTKQQDVINAYVDNREGCSSCWARYICGGGCFFSSIEKNGNIHKAPEHYCDSYKQLFEISMYLYWKIQNFDSSILDQLFDPEGCTYYNEGTSDDCI